MLAEQAARLRVATMPGVAGEEDSRVMVEDLSDGIVAHRGEARTFTLICQIKLKKNQDSRWRIQGESAEHGMQEKDVESVV